MEELVPTLKLVDTVTSTGLLAFVLIAVWQYVKWQSTIEKERIGAQLIFMESLVQQHRDDISKMNTQHRQDMKEMQQQAIDSYDRVTTQMDVVVEAAFLTHYAKNEVRLGKMLGVLYTNLCKMLEKSHAERGSAKV